MADPEIKDSSTPWRPFLEGGDAELAWQAIEAVAAALRPVEKVLPRLAGGTVAGGSAGIALFFEYLGRARDDPKAMEIGGEYFDHATSELARTVLTPGLYCGFSGIAWVDAHLNRLAGVTEVEEESVIDEALQTFLSSEDWHQDYDLISGLTGLGVYGLEGLPRRGPRQCLERVVEHLVRLAVTTTEGLTWFTPVELLPPHQAIAFPEGYFNLGVAHGVPGAVATLARASSAGVGAEATGPVLEGAVRWLLAQRREDDTVSCFADVVARGHSGGPSRVAWCYGDLGIASALLGTAVALDDETLRTEALGIARQVARRATATAMVEDAGLCHGAAGVAHLFLRMARATGDSELADAALVWFERALGYWHPGEGFGGFETWRHSDDSDVLAWHEDPGFLTGSAGIGLALLAAVSEVQPEWDRLLLADLPLLS